jgi:asparagine synthase (glutamine-hydrolysing)
MCGIAGIFLPRSPASAKAEVTAMTATLAHRGPDDEGVWIDTDLGVGLGHRRLSIIDLSPAGAQPMVSPSGRYVITFNGEIYNREALKSDLESTGVTYRGTSDTEVFLCHIDQFGLARALDRAFGMFALGLIDRQSRRLILVRDRVGEKPLYYSRSDNSFLFGSELKALRALKRCPRSVDRESFANFIRYGFITSPQTIYQNIFKVRAGEMVWISLDDPGIRLTKQRWWAPLTPSVQPKFSNPLPSRNYLTKFDEVIEEVVNEQCTADVSVGVLLSSGIDSSLVAAVASQASPKPLKTFTVGYINNQHDESRDAERFAKHIGSDHFTQIFSEDEILSIIQQLPSIYDEPFADSSQIPTSLIANFAAKHVSVALTGDGGDEIFFGYNRYRWAPRIHHFSSRLPDRLNRVLEQFLSTHAGKLGSLSTLLPTRLRAPLADEKLLKLAHLFGRKSPQEIYRTLLTPSLSCRLESGTKTKDILANLPIKWEELGLFAENMRYADLMIYLPDDILTKVDRASMAFGLETRAPLLDQRIIAFSRTLPTSLLRNKRKGKIILREWLKYRGLGAFFDSPKKGFTFPLAEWLRGPLQSWADQYLTLEQLEEESFFDANVVRGLWEAHLTGLADHHSTLWPVLMFQHWKQTNL